MFEVVVSGRVYSLERLVTGFRKNIEKGIACELTFDGSEVSLWTTQPEGFCGLERFTEKGEANASQAGN